MIELKISEDCNLVRKFEYTIQTKGSGDTLDLTGYLQKSIEEAGFENGIVSVFIPGSTAGITTIEFEAGALRDLKNAIERVAPEDMHYEHNARWGDGNGHSHVRAALIGPGLTVPFASLQPMLGTWQQIILLDFDNRPRNRRVIFQVIGE